MNYMRSEIEIIQAANYFAMNDCEYGDADYIRNEEMHRLFCVYLNLSIVQRICWLDRALTHHYVSWGDDKRDAEECGYRDAVGWLACKFEWIDE